MNAGIVELAPERKTFANKYNGDSPDCIGGALNNLAADGKDGSGRPLLCQPLRACSPNTGHFFNDGIILSRDEKTLYVTNGPPLAAFDVQPGRVTHQPVSSPKEDGVGGDGSTVDSAGRIDVSTNAGVQAIGPGGKLLGLIPARRTSSAQPSAAGTRRRYMPWSGCG
jgi:sugar lactone lactonase YvrE